MKLYLNFERQLSEGELEILRGLVRRRADREPLQHIVGTVSFCGFEIKVNRHVLVPRAETELLAELGWKFLGAPGRENSAALDFGTGSGCLAIAVAVKCPAAKIHALDVSAAAVAVAQENAARNQVVGRIEFHCGNGWAVLPKGLKFQLVLSNPPYIPTGEIDGLEPEVSRHDPREALDGGMDGLDFFRALAGEARDYLSIDGRLMAEFGDGQGGDVAKLFLEKGWSKAEIERDDNKQERFLIATP